MKICQFITMIKERDIIPAYRLKVGDKFHPCAQLKYFVIKSDTPECDGHTVEGNILYKGSTYKPEMGIKRLAGKNLVQKL